MYLPRHTRFQRALLVVSVLTAAIVAAPAHAAFFNLRDNATLELIDEANSFGLTRGGITTTFTAFTGGSMVGDLNSTASGFGINAPGAGDATDQIDGVNGIETVALTFDQPVYFNYARVSLLTGADQGSLTIDTNAPINFTSSGFVNLGSSVAVAAGGSVLVSHVAGNGYSFDAFNVTKTPAVTFNLRDTAVIEPLDETNSFEVTMSGIKSTLTAFTGGSMVGDLNVTASGFGVNAPGGGDATDQLDAVNGIESITIMFDQDITFEYFSVSLLSGADAGLLTLPDLSTVAFSSSGLIEVGGMLISAGELVTISYVSGNGFSFDSFTIASVPVVQEPQPQPQPVPSGGIPEPMTATTLLAATMLLVSRRRGR